MRTPSTLLALAAGLALAGPALAQSVTQTAQAPAVAAAGAAAVAAVVRVDLSAGAGYFKFGYVCWYKNSGFGYVYGGIGWGGLNVRLENLTDETPIAFNRRNPLPSRFATKISMASS